MTFIVSILTSYYINKKNFFTANTGKFIEMSFSYNPEIFNKFKTFNNYLSTYTNLININSIESIEPPSLPANSEQLIDSLNQEYSLFERLLTNYLYKQYPDTALSKEYRNLYGKLYMNYDVEFGQEPRVILIIRGENNNDFEAYKNLILKSTSQVLNDIILSFNKDILLRMSELKRAIANITNNNEGEYNYIEQTNILEHFHLEKYALENFLKLSDDLFKKLKETEVLVDINFKFIKNAFNSSNLNSIYFIIPICFIIVISFFVLLFRIIHDFRKK